jgi:hypothetical protein
MLSKLAEAVIPTPDTAGLTERLHDPSLWGKVLAFVLIVAFLSGIWKALKAHPVVLIGVVLIAAVGTGLFAFRLS